MTVKRTVLYGAIGEGQFFDEERYLTVHVARSLTFLGRHGCRRMELGRVIVPPEQVDRPPQFYRTVDLYFDDLESARACFASPEMAALQQGSPAYQNVGAGGFFVEVEQYDFDESGAWTGPATTAT